MLIADIFASVLDVVKLEGRHIPVESPASSTLPTTIHLSLDILDRFQCTYNVVDRIAN